MSGAIEPGWVVHIIESDDVLSFDTEDEARACVADTQAAYDEVTTMRPSPYWPTFTAHVYSAADWYSPRNGAR